MSENKKFYDTTNCKEAGNATLIVLFLLIAAAVGVLAFMAGKKTAEKGMESPYSTASESSSSVASQVAVNQPNDDSPVIAKVNGEGITRNEVFALLQNISQQMQQVPAEQLLPMAIEQEINNKIISQKAAKAKLENNADVLKQLSEIKKQLVRAKFVEVEVNQKITDTKVKEAYADYVNNFPKVEEVKAAHILVDDEGKAKELIKKLNEGADFAELAKESSKDGTAQNGGDLGYFAKTDVVPEFAEAAFSTEIGSYTKAPVKSNFGYHIIKVEDKRVRPAADFETAKPYLEQELRRKALDEIIMSWREEADIERFDIDGNPVQPAEEGAQPEAQEPAAGNTAGETAVPQTAEEEQEAAPAAE